MRSVPEWIGKTDDSRPPPRVYDRVFSRYHGTCQCGCWRPICVGDSWQLDHILALALGGENREYNLHPLLIACHARKTRRDVAVKSRAASVRKKHLGIKKSKWRPIPGSKASGFKKKFDGTVERRR